MFLLYFNSENRRAEYGMGINYVRSILANSYKHMQIDGREISDSIVYFFSKKRKV